MAIEKVRDYFRTYGMEQYANPVAWIDVCKLS